MQTYSRSRDPSAHPAGGASGFAASLGLAALAALVCAVPAAMRVSQGPTPRGSPLAAWMALGAASLGPMLCAIVVARRARDGLRSLAGPEAAARAFVAGATFALLVLVFSLVGAFLRATTHHRALGGVTFALVGLGLAAAVAMVAHRVAALLERASAPVRALCQGTTALALAVGLGELGLRFADAAARDPVSSADAGIVVDLLAFALFALLASRPAFGRTRGLVYVGPPLALLVAVAGTTELRHPAIRAAIEERAPAFAPVADLVPTT